MKRNKFFSKAMVVTSGLVMLTLTMGMLLVSGVVRADDSVSVQASITVPIACTMTGTGTDSHTAILAPNTYSGASGSEYENGIGKTTLTAICNDDTGFSIYAVGYTGNEYGATNLVGENTSGTIATKVYASGDTASNWSMKVTKVTDSTVSYNPANMSIQNSYDSWHAVPSSYTKVAQYLANTGSSATDTTLGAKVETTYAAYIASNQSADTYEGQVKYTLVHPYNEQPAQPQSSASGKICYYANASTAIGSMGCHSVASSVALLASNFSRQGYGFAGWSDKFDYATNSEAHFYGPQEQLSIPDTSIYTGEGKGLSLYAVWVESEGDLQDSSKVATVCNRLIQAPIDGTANLSSVSALTDQRDNKTYAIAKLADGNCWMIENLRLESTNSDNSTGALARGYGASSTYGNFSGLADAENANFSDSTTANSLYSVDGSNGTISIGSSNYPGNRMPRYNNLNTPESASNRPQSPIGNSFANDNTTVGMYSYGNYYTWHAAIADTTYYGSGDHGTTSLCPTGWRLPIGAQSTANMSFGKLSVELGGPANGATANSSSTPTGAVMSAKVRSYPNNFLYSGYFNTSSAYNRGGGGYYWSSTAYSSFISYRLRLGNTTVCPGTEYSDMYYGYSIRCMVSPSA